MGNHELVRFATDEQKRNIGATLAQALPGDLTFEAAERIIGNKDQFIDEINSVFARYELSDAIIASWQEFWGVNLSDLIIPRQREGFGRLLVIAKGATIEGEFQKCRELFKCWKSTIEMLDEVLPTNDRTPANGNYALWVRDRVEADKELRNRSASELRASGIMTLTLLERLVFERKFFQETRGHLDIQSVTLCAGSHSRDGGIPGVRFRGHDVGVDAGWCLPDDSYVRLRAREVAV